VPRVVFEANRLTNVDVNFVALVKRGANRIPFRIMKQEGEEMIDLGKLGRTLFRKAEAPAIAAVLVSKSADLDKVAAVLTKAGLDTSKRQDADETVSFMQAVEPAAGAVVLKLDRDIALLINGIDKSTLPAVKARKDFDDYQEPSEVFSENLAVDGFFPGMWMAVDVLGTTLCKIMCEADEPGAARAQIEGAIDEFRSFVGGLVASIPIRAFKAEAAVRTVKDEMVQNMAFFGTGDLPGGSKIPGGADAGATAASVGGVKVPGAAGAGPGTGGMGDPPGGSKQLPAGGADPGATPSPEAPERPATSSDVAGAAGPTGSLTKDETGIRVAPQKADKDTQDTANPSVVGNQQTDQAADAQRRLATIDEPLTALGARLEKMVADGIAGLTGVISERTSVMQKSVEDLATRVGAVEARATKAEEAVNGTVLGSVETDRAGRVRTAKSGNGAAPPLLDTAYGRPE